MGRADYDLESRLFHGQILGTRDVVTFQGRTPADLETAFPESVDDYITFCESRGENPEKPFSGKFMLRIDPELHRRASIAAAAYGISLNQFVMECINSACCLSLNPHLSQTLRGMNGGNIGMPGIGYVEAQNIAAMGVEDIAFGFSSEDAVRPIGPVKRDFA
jgi:predicted HicB family RNase H-like nuclease